MGWIERQTPAKDEIFLDHVGWFVRDLDATRAQLERLGFRVSPENVHMNRMPDGSRTPSGTYNRVAMLGLGYLEFLASRGDTALAQQHRDQLARYEGLHLMAFNSSDVAGEAPRLREEGFDMLDPVQMRRPVPAVGGEPEAEGRFVVLRNPPETMPEGRVQWCQHLTPDTVWRDTDHPNAIDALTGAVWTVDDVDEALVRYSRYLRKPATRIEAEAGRIELDRGSLVLATPAWARQIAPEMQSVEAPAGALITLRSRDLAKTAACFLEAGIDFQRRKDVLAIPPTEMLGVSMLVSGASTLLDELTCASG